LGVAACNINVRVPVHEREVWNVRFLSSVDI
jgi:hypothetical protein